MPQFTTLCMIKSNTHIFVKKITPCSAQLITNILVDIEIRIIQTIIFQFENLMQHLSPKKPLCN